MTTRNWTRKETLFALYLMFELPFGKFDKGNKEIIDASSLLGRSPSSLAMKLGNLYSCLPKAIRGHRRGLPGSSALDKGIVEEYLQEPDRMMIEAAQAAMFYYGAKSEAAREIQQALTPTKTESMYWRAGRLSQSLFRRKLLSAYESRCCITGLERKELLIASHIKPWSIADSGERIASSNGLLLNALHDKAFDRGLITITNDLELNLSPVLRHDVLPKAVVENFFEAYENQRISIPQSKEDIPSSSFLAWHRKNVFLRSIRSARQQHATQHC